MPVALHSAAPRGNSPTRWMTLLILSLLLHLVALQWVNEEWMAEDDESLADTPPAIAVALLPPPAAAAKPAPPPPPQSPPRAEPVTARPKSSQQPAPAASASAPEAATTLANNVSAAALAAETASPYPQASDAIVEQVARDNTYQVAPPPSAELHYDVRALRQGQNWQGNGRFRWEASGGRYRATVEASIWLLLKITVLSSSSEGVLGDAGIQPVLYSEKPWRKSLMNTHFQHDRRKITFSASEASYPYLGGEQDRVSVVWQLAGIGRADAAQFAPGASFPLVVASTRDAQPWQFVVQGEESVNLPDGKTQAWRVTRVPRSDSYDTRIDIWLAPQRDWYPVRIRYTYKNADYLDLTLKDIAPLATASSP